jgi:hypothetical protein
MRALSLGHVPPPNGSVVEQRGPPPSSLHQQRLTPESYQPRQRSAVAASDSNNLLGGALSSTETRGDLKRPDLGDSVVLVEEEDFDRIPGIVSIGYPEEAGYVGTKLANLHEFLLDTRRGH